MADFVDLESLILFNHVIFGFRLLGQLDKLEQVIGLSLLQFKLLEQRFVIESRWFFNFIEGKLLVFWSVNILLGLLFHRWEVDLVRKPHFGVKIHIGVINHIDFGSIEISLIFVKN
jgi:hypothetical protein